MKGKEWAVIIAVMFVIALIAGMIGAGITGNTIRVSKANAGTEIYTKAEIDQKIANIKTNSSGTTISGSLFIDRGSLSVSTSPPIGGLLVNGKRISTTQGSASNLFLTSDNKIVVVDNRLFVGSLFGSNSTSKAYVCVDFNGELLRSATACR